MKLKFDAAQQFQLDAINSIVDIFKGQARKNTNFTVAGDHLLGQVQTELGIGNRLTLSDEQLLINIQSIQKNYHLQLSRTIQGRNLTVEMETGTGKTYTYSRTMMELNKQYGFSKFIIVVPSVAIREGVNESLKLTEEHFRNLYPGQGFHFFLYNSDRLEMLRDFATSNIIEIMIINIDAFRKSFADKENESKSNLIHRESDKLSGIRPITFIQATNPIVIIDEPQSVDHTDKAKEAIASLNPLFILRYSATHRETYNLMYRLTPVDAYEQRLVKRIEVLSLTPDEGHNNAYIKLISTSNKSGYKAKIEIDRLKNGKTERTEIEVNPNSNKNLFYLSGEREIYKGYIVTGISCREDNEYIDFENGERVLKGQAIGNIDDIQIKRAMIRSTIANHFDKELSYIDKGIKVLSLFFMDRVSNYRIYHNDGSWEKGLYAKIFEEEYNNLRKLSKYHTIFSKEIPMLQLSAEEVHQGYFAQDKKGIYKDTKESGNFNSNDVSAFEEIMKNKEFLLSFDSPRRFIFSHSALKEGWDNPNIFQVCTLIETKDTFTKRQKIGRGLRLPVNQDGERIKDENINILTVIANESYHDFASKLQEEIEEDTGYVFNTIHEGSFESLLDKNNNEIGFDASKRIYDYLHKERLINREGKVTQELKNELSDNSLKIPDEFIDIRDDIMNVIRQVCKKISVSNKNNEVKVNLNKRKYLSPEFKELWERINKKTIYRVNIDTEKLIDRCIHSIKAELPEVPEYKIFASRGDLNISNKGVEVTDGGFNTVYIENSVTKYPDIVRFIQDETKLKRSTIIKILVDSYRLDDFKKNPQWCMEEVTKIIAKHKKDMMVDGIKYERIADEYMMTQFENEEIKAFLNDNCVAVKNSVYDYVVFDSDVEKNFAEQLDKDNDVKLYVKLPKWFKIETPLGSYNPDWALVLDKNNQERLYFVVETKGTLNKDQIRLLENQKIACGKKHFKAINTNVEFKQAVDHKTFIESL